MKPVEFTRAYYIKLGSEGKYEEFSINENRARVGYDDIMLEEINERNWKTLKQKLQSRRRYKTKGALTMDVNALKAFVESTSDDIWITFYASQLWWCKLGEQTVYEDELSRYRLLAGEWHNHDIRGHPLLMNQIPGSISKIQRFQGTICNVKEKDDLKRLINDQPSEAYQAISRAKGNLVTQVEKGLKRLHWKDFETLVDLLFRNAGWNRTSIVGESMKFADLELEERVTGDLYQVQVKSMATVDDFEEYAQRFAHGSFRKLYFAVHSPDENLAEYQLGTYKDVELILPGRLAEMVVDFGLTDWLMKRIR
jgi:hypothetical protein